MNKLDKRIDELPASIYKPIVQIDLLRNRPNHKHNPEIEIMAKRQDWEAHSYCETLEYIFAHHPKIDITEASILDLHRRLYKYHQGDAGHKGTYKRYTNKVETKDRHGNVIRVLVVGTPPDEAPKALNELVAWYKTAQAQQNQHQLLLISSFLVEFLKIHPFVDGNGRISRMLTNLLLLKAGYDFEFLYPHEKIIEQDTEAYYLALSHSQQTFGTHAESIRTWTKYFLNLVHQQAQKTIA